MQKRLPLSVGPSLKKCPKWEPHFAQTVSVRSIPSVESVSRRTAPGSASSKEGHPVPESNFVSEEKSGLPHATQRYTPSLSACKSFPENGASVPFSRSTRYCSGESFSFHSSFVVGMFLLFITKILIFFLKDAGESD